ncbi:MAG: helix-turn-helix domain-containing protein [Fimbriimonadaceae bacterium]|nr:helix-turn-helix domain-containing protein [Fimbriimonadaceae bacterium]
MNLADAIRQAAARNVDDPMIPAVEPTQQQFVPAETPAVKEPKPKAVVAEDDEPETDLLIEAVAGDMSDAPQAPHAAIKAGNAVRIELFLSPEQMTTMLRSIISSQHTMMTLREAASYLRINSSTLEEMAQTGEVPAIHIDGRWRFSRNVVDEWLTAKSFEEERQSDVA